MNDEAIAKFGQFRRHLRLVPLYAATGTRAARTVEACVHFFIGSALLFNPSVVSAEAYDRIV